MRYGHLERKQIILRTLAPIFIGSGMSLNKKEYIFDKEKKIIHFVNLPRLFVFLREKGLLKKYENFLLNNRQNDLLLFLRNNKVGEEEYKSFKIYTIDAGEAAGEEKFREVLTFIKDSEARPYIPGSSLKGVIRTALTAYLISKGNYGQVKEAIEKTKVSRKNRYYLKDEEEALKKKMFYKLAHKDPKTNRYISNPINDFMQGIRISDSDPIDYKYLTLAGKHDRRTDATISNPPIYRECIAPGCEIELAMTLDIPILKELGLEISTIEKALHGFADAYYENFEQFFQESKEDQDISAEDGVDIILGGGSGFPGKTVIYNLYDERDKALEIVSKFMTEKFPRDHQHHRDYSEYKVSPHTLKMTKYKEKYYQMGRCELIIK